MDTCSTQGEVKGQRSDNYHHVQFSRHICLHLSVNSSGPLATDDYGVLGGTDAVPEASDSRRSFPGPI